MQRPPKTCRHPCCTEPTHGWYCAKHKPSSRGPSSRRPAPPRVKTAARGYGGTWRKLRRMQLAREPLCRRCGAPAQDVDHIRPLAIGGDGSFENLQSLCHGCHLRKTAEDKAAGLVGVGGQKIGDEGP